MAETEIKIKEYLGESEMLCQLAEEAAELSQAALKLRRALWCNNPTPVTAEEARANLVEEIADILNVSDLLLEIDDVDEIYDIVQQKRERWLKRLEG